MITDIFIAFVLGIVEGFTEFLPISSTGHQIIVAELLKFSGARAIAFNVIIQLAAILAVMWQFRPKIKQIFYDLPQQKSAQNFTLNIFIAFCPSVVFGLLFADIIHFFLFTPATVAYALIIGGIVILLIENSALVKNAPISNLDKLPKLTALKIGLAQCLALIPGTSRSAATIIGGLCCGLTRQSATEFSFFLAMPTMVAASVYSAYKYRNLFVISDLPLFTVGFITSFICALVSVKALLKFIANHSYTVFAWYRIALGIFILFLHISSFKFF